MAKLPGEGRIRYYEYKKIALPLNALCIKMDNLYDLLKGGRL
jgi:hypothetical protein